MQALWQDIRYGARSLLKRPGFTLIAVMTLALGIGANTTIFSVVNSVLLRPLPYSDSERLVIVWQTFLKEGWPQVPVTALDFADIKAQSRSFDEMAAAFLDKEDYSLTGAGDAEQVSGMAISANMFDLLGARPALGRNFLADEDTIGHDRVVILSQGLWQRKFGADPQVIGKTINLDGQFYNIIGVMPAGFEFPPPVTRGLLNVAASRDLWVPFVIEQPNRNSHSLAVIARLKPDVAVAQADAEIETIARQLEQQYPATNDGTGAFLSSMHAQVVFNVRPALWLLLGAVGFVLLIACANIASLLLTRATARRREMAVRAALGAGRGDLLRQLLVENLLLAIVGGGLGLLLALWGIDLLRALNLGNLPRMAEVGVDLRVFAFTALVSLVTGLLFGLVPALYASRVNLSECLKLNARSSAGAASGRLRSLLVIAEVALALVLLVGAGLLIRSFNHLMNVDPGFNPHNLLTVGIRLPGLRYPNEEKIAAFNQQLIERVAQLPGVDSVGTVNSLPITGFQAATGIYIEGRPAATSISELPLVNQRVVSPSYFQTMGIRIVKGRVFTGEDRRDTMRVVLINETLAERYFAGADPIGKRLKIDSEEAPWSQIVGVVGDVRHAGLTERIEPETYVPFTQDSWQVMALVVRTTNDPANLAAAVRAEVWAIDKDQPVFNVKTMDEILANSLAAQRFNLILLVSFAVVALLMATMGVYGVSAYAVSQRTQEIGIRMALGAQAGDVLKLILYWAMRLMLIGVATGLAAAFALTRLMSSLLFGTSATDPLTFAVITVLLAGVALVACFVPARRATKVDPMVALRYE
jgi:putative ABC transport system permease protein